MGEINKTNDKVNLIHKRVITRKEIKKDQNTNHNYRNKVWEKIHNMEVNKDD